MPKLALLVLVALTLVGYTTEEEPPSPEEASEAAVMALELRSQDSTSEYGTELLATSVQTLAAFVSNETGADEAQLKEAWAKAPEDNQIAILAALGQIGKPYRYARSGPDAFDCSGLVAYAWGEADVDVPHNSRRQIRAADDVWVPQAGDLVYYPGHIMMYLGVGDHVIHAANRRSGVTFGHIRRNVEFGRPTGV